MFAHKWVEQANNNVLELLERLDVVNSKIAEEAMRSFFESRPEVLDSFQFNGIHVLVFGSFRLLLG
jgi:condensin complex subunit 3